MAYLVNMRGSGPVADAEEILSALLGQPARPLDSPQQGASALIAVGRWALLLEAKGSSASIAVAEAAKQLLKHKKASRSKAIPVVVVPFMGPGGQEACRELGVSWLDLSGNADIRGDGLAIHVEGRPNQFKARGRPRSVFAPKASRISRVLLAEARSPLSQTELVRRTELGRGYVSRIVQRLEAAGYVSRDPATKLAVRDPQVMLRDWRSRYEFDKHQIFRGHVPVTGQEDLLTSLDSSVRSLGLRYAATGLAAAWLLASFTGYRLVTLFVDRPLKDQELRALSFRSTDRGANTWIVVPNDEGVFYGAATGPGGIPCVHPVQAYLDLFAQPERASEAADALKTKYLSWPTA